MKQSVAETPDVVAELAELPNEVRRAGSTIGISRTTSEVWLTDSKKNFSSEWLKMKKKKFLLGDNDSVFSINYASCINFVINDPYLISNTFVRQVVAAGDGKSKVTASDDFIMVLDNNIIDISS